MSYNICSSCGHPWGMVNMTFYQCECPKIDKIKGRNWRMRAIGGFLYVEYNLDIDTLVKFDDLNNDKKRDLFAQALWWNWYKDLIKPKTYTYTITYEYKDHKRKPLKNIIID